MKVAKGIKGIRKFLAVDSQRKGWHLTTRTEYLRYDGEKTGTELINDFNAQGYTFMGWTGNGLCFDKN